MSRDPAFVLSPFKIYVESHHRPTQSEIQQLRGKLEQALSSAGVLITHEIREALNRDDIHTRQGFERLTEVAAQRSSTDRTGRPTTSFLAVTVGRALEEKASDGLVPSEAARAGSPARDDRAAQAQVAKLIDQRISELDLSTNRALLEALAKRIGQDGRRLSCDLVNECGHLRHSLNMIEARYASAFRGALARIGIDFESCWNGARVKKGALERLDIALRGRPDVAEAFLRETGGSIESASHEALRDWFMDRTPDRGLLKSLVAGGALFATADRVAESLIRGLVMDGAPRLGPDGESMSRHIGQFGWSWAPRDGRGEIDETASKVLAAGYARLGMTFHPSRRQTFEFAKPKSVEHARLAHEIRLDAELSAIFEAAKRTRARDASDDDLVTWFRARENRLDQVARIATHDLPSSPEDFAREELRRLIFSQSSSGHPLGTMLIVVGNTGAAHLEPTQRRNAPALAAEAAVMLENLGIDPVRGRQIGPESPRFGAFAGRILAHPTLRERIERDTALRAESLPASRVVEWFRAQRSEATILLELAGL
jgi:hypothetical protein